MELGFAILFVGLLTVLVTGTIFILLISLNLFKPFCTRKEFFSKDSWKKLFEWLKKKK